MTCCYLVALSLVEEGGGEGEPVWPGCAHQSGLGGGEVLPDLPLYGRHPLPVPGGAREEHPVAPVPHLHHQVEQEAQGQPDHCQDQPPVVLHPPDHPPLDPAGGTHPPGSL